MVDSNTLLPNPEVVKKNAVIRGEVFEVVTVLLLLGWV
jgi:hypothetical protein